MRKRVKKVSALLAIVLVFLLSFCVEKDLPVAKTLQLITTEKQAELYGPYPVVRVVDGDTIITVIEDENVRVRLIGVDTPESVHPQKEKNSEEGKAAADWTASLLDGTAVYLEYDVSREDSYGRTLAYVYLEDRTTMLNRLLLENGLAQVMTVQPNCKYADEFYELQAKAREAGAGFWAETCSECVQNGHH